MKLNPINPTPGDLSPPPSLEPATLRDLAEVMSLALFAIKDPQGPWAGYATKRLEETFKRLK